MINAEHEAKFPKKRREEIKRTENKSNSYAQES